MLIFLCYCIIETATWGLGIWILRKACNGIELNNKQKKAISIGIYCVIYFIHIYNMWNSYVSNISVLVESIVLGIFYGCYFKVSIWKVSIVELLYWINVSLFRVSILIIEGIYKKNNLIEVNRDAHSLWKCIGSLLIFIFIYCILKKNIKSIETFFNNLSEYGKSALIFCVIQWCMLSYNMWLGIQEFEQVDLAVNIFLILIAQFYLQYLMLKLAQQKVLAENQRLDIVQEILQKRNDELQTFYLKRREQIHKIHHDMMYVYHCLKNKKILEAETFLETYIFEYQQSNKFVWTGLSFLDFMINYKKESMDRKNINFKLYLSVYEYPFEDVELGVLLGNLLDNAIEAAEKCEQNKRFINLQISNLKRTFVLRLKNSSTEKPKIIGKRFFTSKEDKFAHGMGVAQVEKIVNKYNGEIDYQYDSEYFKVDVIVPLQNKGKI